MSRIAGKASLIFGIFLLASGTIWAQAIRIPPHQKFVLPNGLTVLLLEKHDVPLINISAIVKAGAAADPAGEDGLASVTAGLLRKGTRTRTAQQFSADLDFTGGSFEADAGSDFTGIAAEFLSKDAAHGLELLADAVTQPSFPEAEVAKFLAQAMDGVKAEKDDPQGAMIPYYEAYLFEGHPYGRPAGGDENSLKRIQRESIIRFYEANYTPGNTIMAVAGDFQPAEMRKLLETTLGRWQARPVKSLQISAPAPVKGKRLLLVDKPDATQTYFAIGNVGLAETDPDRVAVRLVNTIFGGRFTSQLNEALRVDSGYSYGAQSFFDDRKVAGPFAMFSFTKNETTVPAIDLALEVLRKLHKDGVTSEQLASAKSYVKGQFPPTVETSKQLARLIADLEFYGLTDDEINKLEARMDAVTPEIARQVIQKHFPSENMVFVLIGQASAIGKAVEKYASKEDHRLISDPGFWPAPGEKAGN